MRYELLWYTRGESEHTCGRSISRLADASPAKFQGQIKAWEALPEPGAAAASGVAVTAVVAECAFAPVAVFAVGVVVLLVVFLRR